ncbi:MAG: FAD-dependent oxidoreductase [Sphingobium sp.]
MIHADIVIVGGGIAGASLGASVAGRASVVILEMESQPGYHATGRSVSFWEETYGGPLIQPLTTASGPALRAPDPDFAAAPFLTPRGTLHIGSSGDRAAADALLKAFDGTVDLRRVDPAALIPGLRPQWTIGILEPSCMDIDVASLHQAWLRRFRRLGGRVATNAALLEARREGEGWWLETSTGPIRCALLVNAAGAWADEVAQLCGASPIGLTPLRRTVVQLRIPALPTADLPLLMDLAGHFYFKPDGPGRVWLTPHDETPSPPCDAAPEDIAVAEAIERFEQVVDWPIASVERRWAGLRTFAPDRAPVYGFDPAHPGLFWFAGLGGFGIQTSPAAAALCAAMLTGETPPSAIASIDAAPYSPGRFRY